MNISLSLPAPVKSTSTVTPPSRYLTAKRELNSQFQNLPQAQITLFYNILNFWRLRKHSQENLLKTRSCRIFDGTLVSPTSLFTVVLVFACCPVVLMVSAEVPWEYSGLSGIVWWLWVVAQNWYVHFLIVMLSWLVFIIWFKSTAYCMNN